MLKYRQLGEKIREIDLLRLSARPTQHPALKKTDYLIALTRAHQAHTDLWPVNLRSPLPTLPVPLAPPDEDVPLDLQQALRQVYTDAAYHLSIDYNAAPPPPELGETDKEWVKGFVM